MINLTQDLLNRPANRVQIYRASSVSCRKQLIYRIYQFLCSLTVSTEDILSLIVAATG